MSKAQIYYDKHHSIEQKEAWIAASAVDKREKGMLTRQGEYAGQDVDTYTFELPALLRDVPRRPLPRRAAAAYLTLLAPSTSSFD